MDGIIKWTEPISAQMLNTSLIHGKRYSCVTFDDGFYYSITKMALPELIKRSIPVIIFVPSGYIGKRPGWIDNEEDPSKEEVVLNEVTLKYLNSLDGISIGSHCVSHTSLPTLEDEEARKEIIESKKELEKILKYKIEFISFPNGAFKGIHVKWAQDAGYKKIFSILPMLVCSNNEIVIGRVRVDPNDWCLEFRLKLFGAYRWLPYAFDIKRRVKLILKNIYYYLFSK